MLSENIRKFRKEKNMSQDELAEKVGVSRQSISLWETNQAQPTIDNIMVLARIFNVSTDALLSTEAIKTEPQKNPKAGRSLALPLIIVSVTAIVLLVVMTALLLYQNQENSAPVSTPAGTTLHNNTSDSAQVNNPPSTAPITTSVNNTSQPNTSTPEFDLFTCCKEFAVKTGTLRGDYCIYQQEATKYGGYSNEYFSITYWADSNMVEFCLHCPLDETLSENFYLRMRGGYNKTYEYLTSKYYRDTGVSLRSASGTIDPFTFYDGYPINCDSYQGSSNGQTEFMEESRVGICDLIRCLKQFVSAEKMDCTFADFDFVNF